MNSKYKVLKYSSNNFKDVDDLVSIETNRDHLGEKLVYIDEKNVTVEENIKKYYKQEKDVVHNNKVKQDIEKFNIILSKYSL